MPNFVRAAYDHGIPAVEATFFRTLVLVLVFGALVVLRRERLTFPRNAWPSLAAQGLSTLLISVCYLASVQFIAVGLAVVIFFTFPVFIMLASSLAFGAMVHIAILPFTLAIALLAGGGTLRILSGLTSAHIFLAGIAAIYVAAYLLHMLSLRFARASQVAPFFNLEPVVTTIVAGLLLGEALSPGQYVGGMLVLAALVAAGFLGRRTVKA